jgi:NAD(P)-dependent dehydrogenase (short-subunit alcohol dehydrogenase family)
MRSLASLLDLSGRVALVTGGGIGLGRHIAIGLAEAGAAVVLAGRRPEPLEVTAADLQRLGRRALAVPADVSEPDQVQRLVDRTLESFGRIDVLVNNAGINHIEDATTFPPERWRDVLAVQLDATFYCCQRAGQHMIGQGHGRIVNVASVYGMVGHEGDLYATAERPRIEAPAYAAAKGAVINLTRDLAVTWGRYGVTVNAISPGMFGKFTLDDRRDEQRLPAEVAARLIARTPVGRLGNENDLKGVAVLLASDAGAFITGQNFVVDGGWTAW